MSIAATIAIVAILLCGVVLHAVEPGSPAAAAINSLGIDLLQRTGKPDANALLSPYSIQSAMAMAYAGADGATRDEMAKVLHYPKDEAKLLLSLSALRKALDEAARQSAKESAQVRKYGMTNDPFTLTVANRLFGQAGYDFRKPFLDLLKDTYDAPFEPLDFVHNSRAAAGHINDWVETQTRQRISNLIPDGALNDLTRLVLVNAIYLKVPWAEEFEASATKPGMFHVKGGDGVEVPMMTQRNEFPYGKGDGFSLLQLPYSGYQILFLIILPDKVDGLAAVEAKLTAALFGGSTKWEQRDVTLYMPRLKLEPPVLPLGQTLQALGMKTAFDKPLHSANFDRMAPRRPDDYLALSEVFHKTFLKLDEKGTEAAAATGLVAVAGGIHEPKKAIEVKVDHPFLFAIQQRSSGACLFLGRVTDPR